ncbi:putative glucosylceramidase 4 [Penaeus japonicus]|uniref:putative glucosylceramidase 4 n=1 Tax=Penaeus japonicus TaxID=27405 RepID=UPI001C70B86E|nr:putative glucosylceramidase 4 [Penaeus japonicus]
MVLPRPMVFVVLAVLLCSGVGVNTEDSPCDPRSYGADSVVCVCSSDYCDFPGVLQAGPPGTYTSVTSSRDGLRFQVKSGSFAQTTSNASVVVHIVYGYEYQAIMGFGGAFTDATGINIDSLPEVTQEILLRSYFSPEGLEYNLCRVPIAGSDFSTRPYSYDDVEGDAELIHFNLTLEDYRYKLPYIRRAKELSEKELKLFGSPWSPPAWMKENGHFNGSGGLLKEMWQPWSNYFVKFVEQYEAEGVPLWGLTTQNEPLTGFEEDYPWNTCAWTAEDQRDWIKENLGPTLEEAGLRRLKLMVPDHSRNALPWYPATILDDPTAAQFVDGIAIHWYRDDVIGPSVMDETHDLFPDRFLLYTEACDGSYAPTGERVILGDWSRGEHYAYNIIEDLNHWSTGWVDWNLALDTEGGPNWARNFVDSPIIINKENGEFYKQPMFYALGHFSKFLVPGSRRISASVSSPSDSVSATAFHNPADDTSVVVILNFGDTAENVSVSVGVGVGVGGEAHYINLDIPTKSITTLLFAKPKVDDNSDNLIP